MDCVFEANNQFLYQIIPTFSLFVKDQNEQMALQASDELHDASSHERQMVHIVFRYYQSVTSGFTGIDEDNRGCFCVILDIR